MKPIFTAASMAYFAMADVVFEEKFDKMSHWTHSTWKQSTEMESFQLLPLQNNPDQKDMAFATAQDARFYAASTAFPKPFSNKGKSMLLQYEVTYDTDVECGGGYLKMGPAMTDATQFGDPTEYGIMFGPDKCGNTKRTHLIFNYKGTNKLKKVDLPYKQDTDGVTTLYRMVLHPDNKVEVELNGENVYSGSLSDDWDMLLEKEIEDPDEKKPSDWVEDAMIDDPTDKKPADWIEVEEIKDTAAVQPENWDTEEDGEWEAPMIPNPEYKGEWKAKRISNPDYKGVWSPQKIANPDYVDDKELYMMNGKDFGFIGFDLWQVKGGSRFDNIIIAVDADKEKLVVEANARKEKFLELVDAEKAFIDSTTTTTTTSAPVDEVADDAAPEDNDDDGEDL